ncbi:MAG TPA: MBL fold metallo-hydrolase [Patescibacteria group bacterium]|nr:MBL fold metallo-hydrolase [Patescibacteria group bacterium]
MQITWFGQACFRFDSKDVRVLIDPFSKKIGLREPRINDQIIIVTHDHYDHNNIENTTPESFIIKGPGEYEKSGVQVVGISSFHDNTQGSERGLNTIYVIKLENITLCHLGDIGQHMLTDEQVETIGGVDILFVPIGGTYTVDGKQAVAIVKQIEPKIIVPMHYKVPGLTVNLEGPNAFLKEIGIKPEETEYYKITAKNLPQEETHLIMFKL